MASTAIDVSIITCICGSVTLYFALPLNELYITSVVNLNKLQSWMTASLIGFELSFTIPLLYFVYFESSKMSSTPGKYLLNLKVIPESGGTNTILDGVKRGISILFAIYFITGIVSLINNFQHSILIDFLTFMALTSLVTYPAFRGNHQGLIDILSGKMIVERSSSDSEEEIPPPNKFEQVIRSGRHVSTFTIWLFMAALAIVIPFLPYVYCDKTEMNLKAVALLVLQPVCWLISLFAVWKLRGRLPKYFANLAICFLPIIFSLAFFVQLPNSLARIKATPMVIGLVDQAIEAKENGQEDEYERLSQQARIIESFATSYFGMPFLILDTLNFRPDREEFKKRLAVLSLKKD